MTRDLLKRPMNCVKCYIMKKRNFFICMICHESNRFISNQIRGVARFQYRLLITMPIKNAQWLWRIMRDKVRVVIDSPAVMAILMVKPSCERKMFWQPLAKMPLPNHGSCVTSLFQSIGERSFLWVEPMDSSGWCPIWKRGQRYTEE